MDEQDNTYDSAPGARWGKDKHGDLHNGITGDEDTKDVEDNDHPRVSCLVSRFAG